MILLLTANYVATPLCESTPRMPTYMDSWGRWHLKGFWVAGQFW